MYDLHHAATFPNYRCPCWSVIPCDSPKKSHGWDMMPSDSIAILPFESHSALLCLPLQVFTASVKKVMPRSQVLQNAAQLATSN